MTHSFRPLPVTFPNPPTTTASYHTPQSPHTHLNKDLQTGPAPFVTIRHNGIADDQPPVCVWGKLDPPPPITTTQQPITPLPL